jgi:hypothetical protein
MIAVMRHLFLCLWRETVVTDTVEGSDVLLFGCAVVLIKLMSRAVREIYAFPTAVSVLSNPRRTGRGSVKHVKVE